MKTCGTLALLSLALLIGGCENSPDTNESPMPDPPAQEPVIEEKVIEVIDAMSKLLLESETFRLSGEVTTEEFLSSGHTIELSREFVFTARRGAGLLMDRKSEEFHRRLYFDGKTMSVHDVDRNLYATMEHPGTNQKLLDFLHDEYGMTIPLSDLVMEDPEAALSEFADWGLYMGIRLVRGVRCHHLVLSSDLLEWQLWVQADGDPVPRKLVIHYGDEPGEPRYRAHVTKWERNVAVTDGMLRLAPPADATKIDLARSATDEEE
jgi:hypothetical protein